MGADKQQVGVVVSLSSVRARRASKGRPDDPALHAAKLIERIAALSPQAAECLVSAAEAVAVVGSDTRKSGSQK